MPVQKALRQLCGSESRYRVFKALFAVPGAEYHLRGLATAAGVDPSQVHKLLRGIVEAGLCERIEASPYARYRARQDHPVHALLTELFRGEALGAGEIGEVDLKDAPVLRSLLWTGKERSRIPADEAFKHYERNWRFVRRMALQPKELNLVDRLAKAYGRGLING